MIKSSVFVLFLFCFFGSFAQETKLPFKNKKILASKDTLQLEKVSINSAFFKITTPLGEEITSANYTIDFKKAKLVFNKNFTSKDSLTVSYVELPTFLTQKYSLFDDKKIVPNSAGNLYTIKENSPKPFKPFDGLNTSGSITRGVSIGNNQNTGVNSNLDLQISGKLSDKMSIRASIQDSNIPIQNDGYSQKLDAFDQIFIELYSQNWKIRAGDLFLENKTSKFLNFNKKVQGLSTQIILENKEKKTEIFASGALVRGQYAKSEFVGQEGNQGPYKLKGANGELYVLVISGSERVYVNGLLLNRGENNDYVIDYNAGEIKFNTTFAITSEMRIVVEYQFSERNFTRIVTYGGANHQNKNWHFGGYLYSENDIKNQSLQQNLSQEQVAILQNAGDNRALMQAPSAVLESYSENRILYKKIISGAQTIYQFSNNPTDELYSVKFTFVGNQLGNYKLISNLAVGKIYTYVPPIAGVLQGNYEPIIPLYAPTKLQLATVFAKYNPSKKTLIDTEIAISNNDLNLFSTQDDANNKGIAAKIKANQRIFSKKNKLDWFVEYQNINENFKAIERIFTIEFNRDWNITNPTGNQSIITTGVSFFDDKNFLATYQVEQLKFGANFLGTKHTFLANYVKENKHLTTKNSILKSKSNTTTTQFVRSQTQAKINFKKNWVGTTFRLENNQLKDVNSDHFLPQSQKFTEINSFVGRGDSTKVFAEIGYLKRWNDSVQNGKLQRVNLSNSYYIKSRLIQNSKTNLSVFLNYRNLNFVQNIPDENSLNSRILYTDNYFKQQIQTTTSFETLSGTIAQQEFTYLEVNQGQGVYMWNDYNNNSIQELQEFEVAPYPDLAKYIRVFLPNQIFVKTHQNRLSQAITLYPSQWKNKTGIKKFMSHFYNQSAFSIDQKTKRNTANFNLNPFANTANLLGLNYSFRNSLYFNRGMQKHTTIYNFIQNHTKLLLNIGSQENKIYTHQLQYTHLIKKYWLLNNNLSYNKTASLSDSYSGRNFILKTNTIEPKITYLFTTNCSFSLFYEFKNKKNTIGSFEKLVQQKLGINFNYLNEKNVTLNAEYSFYNNNFNGNVLSPVGFSMLEGLQPGKNSTWTILLQKKLTQFLDININYLGRKSENVKTIHTGNIQLRAYF